MAAALSLASGWHAGRPRWSEPAPVPPYDTPYSETYL